MISRSRVAVTAEQERAALAWLSVLHDQPDSGDQATFSRWLLADPAHAEAYAQAQVVWELSEVAGATLADEESLAMQRYLSATANPPDQCRRRPRRDLSIADR